VFDPNNTPDQIDALLCQYLSSNFYANYAYFTKKLENVEKTVGLAMGLSVARYESNDAFILSFKTIEEAERQRRRQPRPSDNAFGYGQRSGLKDEIRDLSIEIRKILNDVENRTLLTQVQNRKKRREILEKKPGLFNQLDTQLNDDERKAKKLNILIGDLKDKARKILERGNRLAEKGKLEFYAAAQTYGVYHLITNIINDISGQASERLNVIRITNDLNDYFNAGLNRERARSEMARTRLVQFPRRIYLGSDSKPFPAKATVTPFESQGEVTGLTVLPPTGVKHTNFYVKIGGGYFDVGVHGPDELEDLNQKPSEQSAYLIGDLETAPYGFNPNNRFTLDGDNVFTDAGPNGTAQVDTINSKNFSGLYERRRFIGEKVIAFPQPRTGDASLFTESYAKARIVAQLNEVLDLVCRHYANIQMEYNFVEQMSGALLKMMIGQPSARA
jgi:hypothetical protein